MDWEYLLSIYHKSPLLHGPYWGSPTIPLPFAEVDAACSRFVLRHKWIEEIGIGVEVSEPDNYSRKYSLYLPLDETDSILIRLMPDIVKSNALLGAITINKISDSSTDITVETTGRDDNSVRAVVSSFFSNWMAIRGGDERQERERLGASALLGEGDGGEGETAVDEDIRRAQIAKQNGIQSKTVPTWEKIARLYSAGLPQREIAERLDLSERTIRGHIKNMKARGFLSPENSPK